MLIFIKKKQERNLIHLYATHAKAFVSCMKLNIKKTTRNFVVSCTIVHAYILNKNNTKIKTRFDPHLRWLFFPFDYFYFHYFPYMCMYIHFYIIIIFTLHTKT